MPRQLRVCVWIVIAVVAAVAMSTASEVRYLRYMVKLEPPAQYDHPYDGPVTPSSEVKAPLLLTGCANNAHATTDTATDTRQSANRGAY